eukprot:CAMPEP_0204329982 /NCGR_PEP_ID=MMETSP0469-20131031/14568_1 /ASSEMBLY_ACC=CAM_ASM_000384 /TAXON_ID=2969 /ORGANISM="Oxyrrhis marina" /LENGTH=321 /DNA_ID=CAMNT_0051312685 /DNA_START=52 /DNA_END=1017 /DNA_ORIENTATION=+
MVAGSEGDGSGDDDARMIILSEKPPVVVFQNLLTPRECDQVIAAAKKEGLDPEYQVDETIARALTGSAADDNSVYFGDPEQDDPVIGTIRAKMVASMRRALGHPGLYDLKETEHGGLEALQVMRYRLGQKYLSHVDTVAVGQEGPHRRATVIAYLNNVSEAEGGMTVFPWVVHKSFTSHSGSVLPLENVLPVVTGEPTDDEDVAQFGGDVGEAVHFIGDPRYERSSMCEWSCSPAQFQAYATMNEHCCCRERLKVAPKQGDALVFFPLSVDNEVELMAEHGSCPVISEGKEKWIAQLWFRKVNEGGRDEQPEGSESAKLEL